MSERDGEYRIFGPPGTGKTTTLVRQIRNAADKHGGASVLCASFTKAAAVELAARVEADGTPVPKDNVGTVHSLCYRGLGAPEIAETQIADFNKGAPPEFQLSKAVFSGVKARIEDAPADVQDDPVDGINADAIFHEYNLLRNKLTPDEMMPTRVRAWAAHWERWKADNGYMDFTDMLEIGVRQIHYPPGGASILFVDEAQDLTPLQMKLLRGWGKSARFYILVGDDDQCQPAGTIVETTSGPVPIESLDPRGHKLLAYSRSDALVYGKNNGGYPFSIASRKFTGNMHTVRCGGCTSRATPNHIWLTKWNKVAASGRTCVYLMQKGTSFRVGWCSLMRADGCLHVGVRARLEGADKAWVLMTTDSRALASVMESYVAARYGITTALFSEVAGSGLYTQENLDLLHAMLLDTTNQRQRAEDCLGAFGRHIDLPLWSAAEMHKKQGGMSISETFTANIIPELMMLPVRRGSRVEWNTVKANDTEMVDGVTVYSLDVHKYHTYVADGLVTHNCLYNFTGASAAPLLEGGLPEDHIRVLAQSWRVPAKVHALANQWISRVSVRQPKEYKPREHEGAVVLSPATYKDISVLRKTIEDSMVEGRSLMLLTAARYQVRPIIAMLRRWGIPYHNPYRRAAGDWNPIRSTQIDRIKAFLNPAGPEVGGFRLWTPEQLRDWTGVCSSTDLLARGGRKLIEGFCDRDAWELDDLLDLYAAAFAPEALDVATKLSLPWLVEHVKQERRSGHEYLAHLAMLHGIGVLDRKPSAIVGTIHSTKGGEAETVILFPDLPPSACQAACSRDDDVRTEARDSIIRQFYVGMTRAKDTLIICNSATPFNVGVVK